MKHSDIASVIAKLESAKDSFETAFESVDKEWTDAARRDFEAEYVAEIDPNVQKLIDAVARLATVLTNAEHQCSADFGQ